MGHRHLESTELGIHSHQHTHNRHWQEELEGLRREQNRKHPRVDQSSCELHEITISDEKKESKQEVAGAAAGIGVGETAETTDGSQRRGYQTNAISREEFVKRSKQLFTDLDGDKDGYLSDRELTEAAQDNKYRDEDAQVISALYKNRMELAHREPPENPMIEVMRWRQNKPGITEKDLEQFDSDSKRQVKEDEDAGRVRDLMMDSSKFKALDTSGDGKISREEISQRLADANTPQQERDALRSMNDLYDRINKGNHWFFSDDGITKENAQAYKKKTEDERKVVNGVDFAISRTAESQQESTRKSLYRDANNPQESIVPGAIKQGMVGDCYFEASLASMAKAHPDDIQKMIKDNNDGTYTVTFPGDAKNPVTVSAPSEAEMGMYNAGSRFGNWACVMEKAYGQYRKDHDWSQMLDRPKAPVDGADGGGFTGDTMQLLSGRKYESIQPSQVSDAELADKLDKALNVDKTKMVTSGTYKTTSGETEDGYPSPHAYSIVAFRPDGNGGGTVTVRNPWGGVDSEKRMTLAELKRNFRHVEIENDEVA